MDWKRVIGWAIVLFGASMAVAMLDGLIFAHSDISEATIDTLIRQHRLYRRVAIALVAVLCYWRVGAGARGHRAASILVAFVLVQLMDIGMSLPYSPPLAELLDPWRILRPASFALVGYGLARLWPGRSSGVAVATG